MEEGVRIIKLMTAIKYENSKVVQYVWEGKVIEEGRREKKNKQRQRVLCYV